MKNDYKTPFEKKYGNFLIFKGEGGSATFDELKDFVEKIDALEKMGAKLIVGEEKEDFIKTVIKERDKEVAKFTAQTLRSLKDRKSEVERRLLGRFHYGLYTRMGYGFSEWLTLMGPFKDVDIKEWEKP